MSEQELQPPAGWIVQRGGGGWRAVNKTKLWSTNVFTVAQGGAAKAVEAAIELERKAGETIAAQERLCAALRRYFHAEL